MTTDTDPLAHLRGAPDIDGLWFRRPRLDDDLASLAALMGEANAFDDVPSRPTPDNLRLELEPSERMDPAHDVIVAEVGGRLVGEAEVERVVRDGVVVYHVSGFVHPSVRRRGLGRALLHHNLRRAAERAAGDPAGMPVELGGFVDEQEAGHRALLSSEGFEVIRWFFLMRRDLAEPVPEAPLPEGFQLRPVTRDHYRQVFDAEVEAFRDHWGAREKTETDFTRTYAAAECDPSLWVVAWAGDEVAGVVQNWIWTSENAALGVARGWLEHISVRGPWRRRGLARAITAESLRRLRHAGMTEAMLGVDTENANGALGLYEDLGFRTHIRSSAYRRPLVLLDDGPDPRP